MQPVALVLCTTGTQFVFALCSQQPFLYLLQALSLSLPCAASSPCYIYYRHSVRLCCLVHPATYTLDRTGPLGPAPNTPALANSKTVSLSCCQICMACVSTVTKNAISACLIIFLSSRCHGSHLRRGVSSREKTERV